MPENRLDFSVACYRCWKSVWHATGRFNTNRRGLRRAELRCDACGYVFSSARPAALQAGELAAQNGAGATISEQSVGSQPAVDFTVIRHPADGVDKTIGSVGDWKRRQAQDE